MTLNRNILLSLLISTALWGNNSIKSNQCNPNQNSQKIVTPRYSKKQKTAAGIAAGATILASLIGFKLIRSRDVKNLGLINPQYPKSVQMPMLSSETDSVPLMYVNPDEIDTHLQQHSTKKSIQAFSKQIFHFPIFCHFRPEDSENPVTMDHLDLTTRKTKIQNHFVGNAITWYMYALCLDDTKMAESLFNRNLATVIRIPFDRFASVVIQPLQYDLDNGIKIKHLDLLKKHIKESQNSKVLQRGLQKKAVLPEDVVDLITEYTPAIKWIEDSTGTY